MPKKFDVVGRTHRESAAYDNVDTDSAHIVEEGLGWTNASFQFGLTALTPERREALRRAATAAAADAGTPIARCPKPSGER